MDVKVFPPSYVRYAWLIVIVGSVSLTIIGFGYSEHRLSDFTGYYTAAKVLATSDSLARLYDDVWFTNQVKQFGINETTFVMYVNLPTVAFIMLPLQSLDPFTAKLFWNSFTLLMLLPAFVLAKQYFKVPKNSQLSPLLFGLLACTLPFLRSLQRGQVYVLMLVLVLLMMIGYQQQMAWLTGIPLAALLLLKYFGWMFLILFLVERKWKEIGITLLSVAIGIGFTFTIFGVNTYSAHFHQLSAAITNNDFAFTGLPSVQAFFGALFVEHPTWNPSPVANLPWLAQALTAAELGITLYLFWRRARLPLSPDVRICAILLLSVIFTPLAADHHYILLVPPAFLLMQSLLSQHGFGYTIITLILLYILLGWYPNLQIRNFEGWAKIVCFPRLYAGVAVWGLILWKGRSAE